MYDLQLKQYKQHFKMYITLSQTQNQLPWSNSTFLRNTICNHGNHPDNSKMTLTLITRSNNSHNDSHMITITKFTLISKQCEMLYGHLYSQNLGN